MRQLQGDEGTPFGEFQREFSKKIGAKQWKTSLPLRVAVSRAIIYPLQQGRLLADVGRSFTCLLNIWVRKFAALHPGKFDAKLTKLTLG